MFVALRAGDGISWPGAWTGEPANPCLGLERFSSHHESLHSLVFSDDAIEIRANKVSQPSKPNRVCPPRDSEAGMEIRVDAYYLMLCGKSSTPAKQGINPWIKPCLQTKPRLVLAENRNAMRCECQRAPQG